MAIKWIKGGTCKPADNTAMMKNVIGTKMIENEK